MRCRKKGLLLVETPWQYLKQKTNYLTKNLKYGWLKVFLTKKGLLESSKLICSSIMLINNDDFLCDKIIANTNV